MSVPIRMHTENSKCFEFRGRDRISKGATTLWVCWNTATLGPGMNGESQIRQGEMMRRGVTGKIFGEENGPRVNGFSRPGICLLFLVLMMGPAATQAVGKAFHVMKNDQKVELRSPLFTLSLDTSAGLRADRWENRLTGRIISLGGGSEVEIDLDTAESRIWLPGLPATVLIPADARGKPLSLTMGGFGLYDYRFMRVLLNGHEVGVRDAPERWRAPLVIDLGPGSPMHSYVRFGEENEIAAELSGLADRSPRLEELDPRGTRGLPDPIQWPATFEKYLTIGVPMETPRWEAARGRFNQKEDGYEAVFRFSARGMPISATVTYRWNNETPVLRKSVEILHSGTETRRLLHARLGDYPTDARVSDGERGFPVYLDNEFFLSLAHPAGWATGHDGRALLRQYPGTVLKPGVPFRAFDVIMGVTKAGSGKAGFVAYLRRHMRRVVRGHDRPYAIFSNFGSWPLEPNNFNNPRFSQNSEEDVLHSLARLAESQKATGRLFDTCSVDFWLDHAGNFRQFEPRYFPNGFTKIKNALDELGIAPGLWVSTSYLGWGLGRNAALNACKMPSGNAHCLAAEPYRTVFASGLEYQIRKNGIRQIKVDGLYGNCDSPGHGHLPGVYSTEAQFSAMVDACKRWDAANPDVFIMLYWGSRSPWWLIWADTLFDPGVMIEASTPAEYPTPHARDSVTVGLDQAQWYCDEVPRLGKDSLGIWLSDWWWNSSIGKERWQEGFVMDLCRGSLLAQIWSGRDRLSEPEWKQLAVFIRLLKARPECFGNPRFILGNPWNDEPYGYRCTDGKRAFLAINNCVWGDTAITLKLDSAWGLPDGKRWDLYRWYPAPARLKGEERDFGSRATISLRPFEVVLLEVVPAGQPPSLDRVFDAGPIPKGFAEASRPVEILVQHLDGDTSGKTRISGRLSKAPSGGTLVIAASMSRNGQASMVNDIGEHFTVRGRLGEQSLSARPVLGQETYPVCWQAWRMTISPAPGPVSFELDIAASVESDIQFKYSVYFVPH